MQTQTQLSRIPIPVQSSLLRSRSPSPSTNIFTQTVNRNNIMSISQLSCLESNSEFKNFVSETKINKSKFGLKLNKI